MKRKTIAGIVIIVMLVLSVIAGFNIIQISSHPPNLAPVSVPDDHGSVTPLFTIYNEDPNNSHEVAIEIFNSNNESIFKEFYKLNQNEWIEHPKPPVLWSSHSRLYTFKVVLDNETTDILRTKIDPWTTPTIFLYHTSTDYSTSGEIIPLEILVATV
ncbi:MAG: hypothetical protein HF976_07400 [ANME-2 cluster archaeon]|nr:hypothetical protein [ANME-2 cluster archaeon]MBC2701224.1 hypothetical protein [ANME-2 cluster archaeon]MBC2707113.1 hypothetical protein [ANME-2 cluster archaeon]MBC2747537.1 hypothetical protein [ANME-2 cluster archaeon]